MNTITIKDGITIYFKDWGADPVVTFSHGWPLNADAWDSKCCFSESLNLMSSTWLYEAISKDS